MKIQETQVYKSLKDIAPNATLLANEPLSKHTTFKVGGEADLFVKVADTSEICAIIKYLNLIGYEYYILGKGSNILASDKGYRGIILSLDDTSDVVVENNTIRASAGVSLSKIASVALNNSLTGMEFASGIPGSFGGAIFMNAGAYGGEMKDIVKSVDVITSDGNLLTLSNDELKFSYRESILKHQKLMCLSAVIELQPGNKEDIKSKMIELSEQRRAKQPLEYPSAGSTFKRPEGYFAGKLIMDAGMAGFTIGGAQVSKKHCGFIINVGNASAADIKDLIDEVSDKVYSRFGVRLEPEVCLLGDF